MINKKPKNDSAMLTNRNIARCLNLAILTLIAVGLSACSRTISFEEEVEIGPGEVIVIKRSEKQGRTCEAFSCGWGFEHSTVTIPVKGVRDWKEELWPMHLQKNKDGTLTLIARTVFVPCPRYHSFIFRNNEWKEIPIDEKYFGMTANLLIPGKDEFESKSKKITLLEKKEKNDRPGLSGSTKRILRNPPC